MKLAFVLVALLGLASAAAALQSPADFTQAVQRSFEARFGGARNFGEALAFAKDLAPQRKCAANDDKCIARCLTPVGEYFSDHPDCFNSTGASPFPEGDLTTAAELEQLCTCGPKIIKGMRLLFSALDCVGNDILDMDGPPFTPDQLVDVMDVMFEFQCIKQGGTAGEFCALVVQEAEQAYSLNGTRDWGVATNETKCDYLTEIGCCGASYMAVFEDKRFTEFLNTVGADDPEMNTTILEIKQAYTDCGYNPSPCLKPGESATYVKALAEIDADYNVLASNETALDAFKVAFREDVASALKLSPPQVEIISVTSGSVKVAFQIRGKDKKAALDSALKSGIPLTNVKQQSGFSNADNLDEESTTSETVEEKNNLSPASTAAVPSLAALLLLALFALFQ